MPELQDRLARLLPAVLPAGSALRHEWAPPWLVRPGRVECGAAWPRIANIYRLLTGADLPETMPPRERRRLDVVVTYPGGEQQIVEVDETQHFTAARATTLGTYGADVAVAFDVEAWLQRSIERSGREPGGGFARPRPPLFPEQGGRHKQRAFRDALADMVPLEHGWRPTIRFSDLEVKALLEQPAPDAALDAMLRAKQHH